MKIAFLTRVDAFEKNGGDTYQLQMYKKYFEMDGFQVSIVTSLIIPEGFDFYILVNMDRPIELIEYYNQLKKLSLERKTLFLPIHHSYEAIDYFEKNHRQGTLGVISKFTNSFHQREKIKNIIRGLKYKKLLKASYFHLFIDYKKIIQEIIKNVRAVVLIAEDEKDSIEKDFDVKIPYSFVVNNGVDLKESNAKQLRIKNDIDILVCGRIEARKNSLAIAQRFARTDYRVVFVGAINNNDKKYANAFLKTVETNANILYLGRVSPEKMPEIYMNSRIHLSASWFEVASLVDLEAYAYGCHVISSTHGHTKNYLAERAFYLDPRNLENIDDIITKLTGISSDAQEQYNYISKKFTWHNSYKQLFEGLNNLYLKG